jgi:purine-binding chemotaxis protein CheW
MSQDAIAGPEIEASASQVQHVEDRQTVVFRLSGESYGIEIFRVNEIIRMRDITPIPRTEAHISGLVNLRGKTIPVVDLRVRMGLEVVEETDSSRIIVVDAEDGQVGIIVDAVNEVVTLEGQHIEPTPSLANDDQTEFVEAVAKRDAELVTLLNLDSALAA